MENLLKAVIEVMKEVEGIDKTLQVGTGISAYKGVSDQEVKKAVGRSMSKNGLAIFPVDIQPNVRIEHYDENYQGNIKRKQTVFTDVLTTYRLYHTSGESIEIKGYGHGVDTQDKSAGKATTYALKYALLYTFLIPTGKIDDADKHHSNEYEKTSNDKKGETNKENNSKTKQKGAINEKRFQNAFELIKNGDYSMEDLKANFQLTPEQIKKLDELKKVKND
jgi:hypothetical protein